MDIISAYSQVINSEFKLYKGGVFRLDGMQKFPQLKRWVENDSNLGRVENDWNHFHFDHSFSKDIIENFHVNYSFAVAAKRAWEFRIGKKSFKVLPKIFIVNELMEIGDETQSYFDIYPTLRLWSVQDRESKLFESYKLANDSNALDLNSFQYVTLSEALKLAASSQG